MNETYNTLFIALRTKGFVAPCASDMANYLISCLSRPEPASNVAGLKKDVQDIIDVLTIYKETL